MTTTTFILAGGFTVAVLLLGMTIGSRMTKGMTPLPNPATPIVQYIARRRNEKDAEKRKAQQVKVAA